MRKFSVCFLALLMSACSVLSACSEAKTGKEKGNNPSHNAEYELWSAPNTEKILLEAGEKSVDYSDVRSEARINVDTAKAEYEAAQIVITSKTNVNSYTVQTSDLKDADGNVYKAENVLVYNMMYVKVNTIYESARGGSPGMWPDGIMPMDTAVEYGMNKMGANENQTIYFSFNTPAAQQAGTYTGTFKLTIDGEVNEIPVCVKVRGVTVSETVTSKSVFLDTWQYYLGEYDGTQDMLDIYHERLMDYRLAPGYLVTDYGYSEEDAEYYAEKVAQFASNKRFSNYLLPVQCTTLKIDSSTFQLFCEKILLKSFETGLNLLDKAIVYRLDEPKPSQAPYLLGLNQTFEAAKLDTINRFRANTEAYAEDYKATYEAIEGRAYETFEEFMDAVCKSVSAMQNVVTTKYEDYFDPNTTWCPLFDSYDNPSDLAMYQQQEGDRWWYGCIIPNAPYCTYHIEDYLLAPRVLGWLQSVYDVRGNLYWGVNNYADLQSGYQYADDLYSVAARYTIYYNGEGWLFYPGTRFGTEPIATIRLEAIRDGLEEYELLQAIKAKYEQTATQYDLDVNIDATLENITQFLHSGAQINATTQSFATARKALLDWAEFSETGATFLDFNDDGEGHVTYKLFVPEGVTLTTSLGEGYGSVVSVDGGKIYQYNINLSNYDGEKNIRFTANDGTTSYTMERQLSGKVEILSGEFYKASLNSGVVEAETLMVDALDGSGAKWLQLAINGFDEYNKAENLGYRKVVVKGSEMLSKFTTDLSKATIKFYYDAPAGSEVTVSWYVKYKGLNGRVLVAQAVLKGGEITELTWGNIYTVQNLKTRAIEDFHFQYKEATLEANATADVLKDVYVASISFYGV